MSISRQAAAIRFSLGLLLAAVVADTTRAESTRFYVVRHAERATASMRDVGPPLTAVGMRRAEELRELLRGVPITAVYSSRTLRTWQTATPTASQAGVEITPYDSLTPAWFNDLKAWHAGDSVLIVGHSETVRDIVAGLGGTPGPAIGEEFDNLFVVVKDGANVRTERRKYHVLEPIQRLQFPHVPKSSDLSAVAEGQGGDLIIASDEGSALAVLKKNATGYELRSTIALGEDDDDDKEFDVEGITRHGEDSTYVIAGSHALRRKSIFRKEDATATLAKNRDRFEEPPDREKNRERLIRLRIDPSTGRLFAGSRNDISIRSLLDEHTVLKPFSRLPATENGIDIEGIASDGERLYLGLRGPALRFGFGLVLVINPEAPHKPELRYLRMEGRGVRDLVRVRDGFLVIAGPVGDSSLPCQLYHWDGNNELPGVRKAADPPQGRTTLLGTIPAPPNAEPEGIVALTPENTENSYKVLIIYDGVDGGNPTVFRAAKP